MPMNKPSLAVLIGKMKPGESDDESDAQGESSGLEATAQEILDAIEANDSAGLADSLKSFCEQCMSEGE
jgi:hypothetical protein